MSRLSHIAALAIACTIAAPSAYAQERIEFFAGIANRAHIVEVDATLTGFGDVRAITPIPASHLPTGGPFGEHRMPMAVAGGRYIAWTSGERLLILDRRTRAVLDATSLLPPFAGYPSTAAGGVIVDVDSHQPRLFFLRGTTVSHELWVFDLGGRPAVRLATSTGSISGAAYSAARDEAFVLDRAFENGGGVTWVVVVNATTGAELRRWKMSGFVSTIRADPAGRVVWVQRDGLEVLDAGTGATLATAADFNATLSTFDAQRNLLISRQGDFLVALDPLRLVELGRARIAFTPPDPVISRTALTLPGRWMTGAYTARAETRTRLLQHGRTGRFDVVETTCNALDIDAVNPDGSRRDTVDLLTPLGGGDSVISEREFARPCVGIGVVVRSPFAPTGLTADVVGKSVSLAWSNPGDTTDFEIEYGFAPGQRAGGVRVGATTLGIPNVPPGVYYVRVKGLNEVGSSPPSNEVRVVVP